jgi:hypothetical protein
MTDLPTSEEIAELIEFVRDGRGERAYAIAIAEKLPAMLAERAKVDFVAALQIADRGFNAWKDKPHNAKWFKRIDGTPIPNDLLVNIANEIIISAPFYAPVMQPAERDRLAAAVEKLTNERDEAREVAHYANGTADLAMKHRDKAEASLATTRETIAKLREALESLLPAARAWEFAETRTYCYGDGRTEPFEWGLDIQFQQSSDAMPADQFATAVERFHAGADEEEADLPSRRARAALAQIDAAPDAKGSGDMSSTRDGCRETFGTVEDYRRGKIEEAGSRAMLRDAETGAAGGMVDDAPGHTDLMISPEAIDEALTANPLPEALAIQAPPVALDVESESVKTFAFAGIHGFDPPAENEAESLSDEDLALEFSEARREMRSLGWKIEEMRQTVAEAVEIMNDCRTVARAIEGLVMFIKTGERLHPDSSAVTDIVERAHRLSASARDFVEKYGKKEVA